MCNYIFKKGQHKGASCPVKQRNGDYCSRHMEYLSNKPKNIDDGKCKHIFKQGSKRGEKCTTRPRNGDYCSKHANMYQIPNEKKVEVPEPVKNKKCSWGPCQKKCSLKGGLTDKYCDVHVRKRDRITTIYRDEYKGDYMFSTGFVFKAETSRYRPENMDSITNKVKGKVIGAVDGRGGVFTTDLTEDDLAYCKDVDLEYEVEVEKLVHCNYAHEKVCDLCFKFCCTTLWDIEGVSKRCDACRMSNKGIDGNVERAWELVGKMCKCESCVAEYDETDYFDPWLYPYRFERDPRIKCKVPTCFYHVENRQLGLCSLCDEARLHTFKTIEDPTSESYKVHIPTRMIVKLSGERKVVVGKIDNFKSIKIDRKEITKFDNELINDFSWHGWVKGDDVIVVDN